MTKIDINWLSDDGKYQYAIDCMQLEIERLKKYQESYKKELDYWRIQYSDLRAKIDKAIEYINKYLEENEYGEIILTHTFDKHNLKELKDILGSDKE